jgi:hypothetical protein
MTCWRDSPMRRIGEADKMTCKQKRLEKEALSGTSLLSKSELFLRRGGRGGRYGSTTPTIVTSDGSAISLSSPFSLFFYSPSRETVVYCQ